jgi:hypothetical protein
MLGKPVDQIRIILNPCCLLLETGGGDEKLATFQTCPKGRNSHYTCMIRMRNGMEILDSKPKSIQSKKFTRSREVCSFAIFRKLEAMSCLFIACESCQKCIHCNLLCTSLKRGRFSFAKIVRWRCAVTVPDAACTLLTIDNSVLARARQISVTTDRVRR